MVSFLSRSFGKVIWHKVGGDAAVRVTCAKVYVSNTKKMEMLM